MDIIKTNGKHIVCFSAQELLMILISDFFSKLSTKVKNEGFDSTKISKYIKQLSDKSVDSRDEYEYYVAILDLYEQFEKNCSFCFNLKDTFNYKTDIIKSFQDLQKHREDPPDVIVKYKNQYYEFELKRYRGVISVQSLFEFIKRKILDHYSGKSNYLVVLQPAPGSGLSYDDFKELHELVKKEKNQPGMIGLSLNNDNKEMILVRILPEIQVHKRKFNSEVNQYADILHTE